MTDTRPDCGDPLRGYLTVLPVALIVLGLDQLTKRLITDSFTLGESRGVLGAVLHFTCQINTGGAFSMLPDSTAVLSVVSGVVVLGLLLFGPRLAADSSLALIGLGLVAGGALGNLLDRIRLGYVVDFIDFRVWPVFNVADIGITVGAGLLILALATGGKPRPDEGIC